jgi:hypothetical protein
VRGKHNIIPIIAYTLVNPPPFIIEVRALSQDREWSYVVVLEVSILPLSRSIQLI